MVQGARNLILTNSAARSAFRNGNARTAAPSPIAPALFIRNPPPPARKPFPRRPAASSSFSRSPPSGRPDGAALKSEARKSFLTRLEYKGRSLPASCDSVKLPLRFRFLQVSGIPRPMSVLREGSLSLPEAAERRCPARALGEDASVTSLSRRFARRAPQDAPSALRMVRRTRTGVISFL